VPIRVVIADDHRMFAEALAAILGGDGRIEVVAFAANGREAVDAARATRPDVVLMDISMPVMDGIAAAEAIRDADGGTKVVMLTGSSAAQDIARARSAGAAGYVTKDAISAELVDAILAAARG
jgi:DNA-binding NarL/FixJ family response regulator